MWPRDWPIEEGTKPAGSPSEAEEAHMDEDMTDLLGYLGEGKATRLRSPHL